MCIVLKHGSTKPLKQWKNRSGNLQNGWFSPENVENFFMAPDIKALSNALNKKTGMVNKGAGKEYRLINHWDNQEIIPAARDSNKQW